ncbi:ANR35 protein, partial [Podargus strigoides]|nr:ANR35 protein [Podargus strigoides]
QSVGTLRERAGQLARACRDKEGTMKKLLAETEKLSAEVLGLRSRSTQLQLQLEVCASTRCHPVSPDVTRCPLVTLCTSSPPQLQQKNHRDTVAVYRTHLLNAAQGFMDQGVHAMLLHILRSQ